MKKKNIKIEKKGKCKECMYISNLRSPSMDGVPTLGTCKFEKYAVLYQRECCNGQFKQK